MTVVLTFLFLILCGYMRAQIPALPSYKVGLIETGNPKEAFYIEAMKIAMDFAAEVVKEKYRVNLEIIPGAGDADDQCEQSSYSNLMGQASVMLRENKPDFLVGPSCSWDFQAIMQIVMLNSLPTFTGWAPYADGATALSPAFYRIGFSGTDFFQTAVELCLKYGWFNIALIWYQHDLWSTADKMNYLHEKRMITFRSLLVKSGKFKFKEISHYDGEKDNSRIEHNLWKASNESRVFFFFLPKKKFLEYMIAVDKERYTNGEYVFLTLDPFADQFLTGEDFMSEPNAKYVPALKQLFILSIKNYGKIRERINWNEQIKVKLSADEQANYYKSANSQRRSNHYDMVIILGKTINKILSEPGRLPEHLQRGAAGDAEPDQVQLLHDKLCQQIFRSTDTPLSTDEFYVDEFGDRRETYMLYHVVDESTMQFEDVFSCDTWTGTTKLLIDVFKNKTVPVNRPKCGFSTYHDTESCLTASEVKEKKESAKIMMIALLSTGIPFGMLLVVISALLYVRNRKRQEAVKHWRANTADLTVYNPNDEAVKLRTSSKAKAKVEDDRTSENSMGSAIEGLSLRSGLSTSEGASIYKRQTEKRSDTGFWKKTMVTVRWCYKRRVPLSDKLILEVEQVQNIQHDNIAVFAGACLDKDMVMVIYEYCSRGSLQDLIERQGDKFDWTMRIAFLNDILNGLIYLSTTPVVCHGRLTSECCHIDRSFVITISDCGLPSLFTLDLLETWVAKRNPRYLGRQLWQSPEQLFNPETKKTSELDAYSFGIILQEIVLREPPYAMFPELTFEEIARFVRMRTNYRNAPMRPFFPPGSTDHADSGLIELAQKCWTENPKDRPRLSAIKEELKKAATNMGILNTGSIMDMLMIQMDQQSAKLQAIVEEKGRAALKEKQKADMIIQACLDARFADKLKQDEDISPEAFEIVTVLLVNISHFQHILQDSTPSQLIDVLNDYNHFLDTGIAKFDCRKMDTEVDLITVASGIPKRNGILNARETCRLALTLQYRVRELRFHHRPNDPVKLQMGIHSGACVAAVLGKHIPRYSVLGDTIDITKRMLVTGLPQKIHISSYTKDVLETFGSFRTEERGEIFVKGKGALTTYWLTGEDGNKELKTLQTKYEAALFADEPLEMHIN